MNILDLPATIQLGKVWRWQSTTEMLERKYLMDFNVLLKTASLDNAIREFSLA